MVYTVYRSIISAEKRVQYVYSYFYTVASSGDQATSRAREQLITGSFIFVSCLRLSARFTPPPLGRAPRGHWAIKPYSFYAKVHTGFTHHARATGSLQYKV